MRCWCRFDVWVQVPSAAPVRFPNGSIRSYARVVELADSLDSGSSVHYGRAGSSPASRTTSESGLRPRRRSPFPWIVPLPHRRQPQLHTYARVVELADSLDSGSSVHYGRAGSSPASRTKKERHLLKADVFLFWVPPPKGRLHPPVFQMLGGSEFRLRRGFACGKTLARRKCAAGQKAGLTVLLPLPQPLKISILTALYMVGASFVSLAPIFSFKVRSCRCGSFQIATSEQGFDLISLDEDHEFHTVAHTMVGATFSLPRLSLCAHAKKRSSALLLFHRLKSNPRSLDFDPVFSAGISSPVPIPIPETRLVLTSRVIFLSFLQSEPFSTACLISCREMKAFSSPGEPSPGVYLADMSSTSFLRSLLHRRLPPRSAAEVRRCPHLGGKFLHASFLYFDNYFSFFLPLFTVNFCQKVYKTCKSNF